MNAVTRWLFQAAPGGRVAALRTLCYLFVAADLVYFTPWVRAKADLSPDLYQPLLVGRVLPLPTPSAWLVHGIFWVLIAVSLAAATGRAPRLLGWAVFALYFEWMVIAMSYGKVDHDRFAFLVALAVLPTAGRARHGDATMTEPGGWAQRTIQIAVVATYFLACLAKLRYGGPGWMTGSVLAHAIVRRGTDLADIVASVPGALVAAQIGIMAFELLSPLVFVLRPRWRYAAIAFFYSFHLATIATITISFAPHLVAMTSFLPLERLRPVARIGQVVARRRPGAPADQHRDLRYEDAAGLDVRPRTAMSRGCGPRRHPCHPGCGGGCGPPNGRPAGPA